VSSGCLVLPFAVPPTSVSGSAGGAIGKIVPVEEGGSGQTEAEPVLLGRVGMAPLGLTPELSARRFDFQLGYVVEGLPKQESARYTKHGAYGAFTFYPWVSEELSGGWRGRFGLSPVAEVLVEPETELVGGGGNILDHQARRGLLRRARQQGRRRARRRLRRVRHRRARWRRHARRRHRALLDRDRRPHLALAGDRRRAHRPVVGAGRLRRAALLAALAHLGCDDEPAPDPGAGGAAAELCTHLEDLDNLVPPASYAYDWSCSGEVPPGDEPLPAAPPDDCASGIWPDLDDTADICPTVSDATRTDPVSGKELPSADARALPLELEPQEAGSFLPPSAPESWPAELRVVAWNLEYSADLDAQRDALLSHPELSRADVFLLSEVDRCSQRNGVRRAARELAQALEAAYVYGVEFVELDIGRVVGGDTGQAILSRRPLRAASLLCHSSQSDWFASDDEPRLGQRVALSAEVPVGPTTARLYAVHLESDDVFGARRSIQSKELLDVSQARACERPQIFGGDFNAPYCGAPELEVLRGAGFIDAVAVAGDTEPTHDNGFRLDYLWTKGFRVVGGGVARDVVASDHSPVWVDLLLE
jgi:endonuclease/exonuclease/phosphatase family metal-dependent hydrolase